MNNQNNNGMNMSNTNLTNNTNVGVNNNPVNSQPTGTPNMEMNTNTGNTFNNSQYGNFIQSTPSNQNIGMNQGINNCMNYANSPMQNNISNQQNMNQGYGNGMNHNYYQQPMPNYSMNSGKQPIDKKSLALVIGIIVLIAVAIVVAVLLLNKDKDDETNKENVNEYEETTNNNDDIIDIEIDDDSGSTSNTSGTEIYGGFEFQKVAGYTYTTDVDGLYAESNTYSVVVDVIEGEFAETRGSYFADEFKESFEEIGYKVGRIGTEYISGTEVFVSELSDDGINALYYMIEANDEYIFHGLVANSLNTFDHESNIKAVLEIVENAEYVGGYSGYTSSVDGSIDISQLQ